MNANITYYCVDCAAERVLTVATHHLTWDLGSMWLCEKHYIEHTRWGA